MDKVMEIIQWVIANYQLVISSFVGILTGVIAIALLIPGEQPEKFLQGIVDFLGGWSSKPKDK